MLNVRFILWTLPFAFGAVLSAATPISTARGRQLYLKNCAHCHAEDATGDEGPDLHGLKRSADWLGKRINNGIKGEMPAFGEKFTGDDVSSLISYLRTLERENPAPKAN